MPPATSAAAGLPVLIRRDFPHWLPPMLVKELRQGLRTRGFVGALIVFQIVMLVVTLFALAAATAVPTGRPTGPGFASGFFWTVIGVQLILVTPARALGGLQQEVDSRSVDLLMLTHLDAGRIVAGKWISLVVQAALLLIAMLPYLVVRYFSVQADLVADLGDCLVMLGASAMLTAAALWTSGASRIMRVLLVILMVVAMQGFSGLFSAVGMGRGLGGAAGSFGRIVDLPVDALNAVLLTGFFLVSAVRNIAPPAENHCLLARSLPLLAILCAPLLHVAGQPALALRQLAVGAVFLALVLLIELSASREPMACHWRRWDGRGRLRSLVGRGFLPGWPSALVFGLAAAGVWALLTYLLGPPRGLGAGSAERTLWLGLLAFTGLVFPVLLRSFFRTPPAIRTGLYFAGLAAPMILSGVAVSLAESRWKLEGFKTFMETMPVSSFLFEVARGWSQASTPAQVMAQGGIAVAVVALALWQSRPYWRGLDSLAAGEPRSARE